MHYLPSFFILFILPHIITNFFVLWHAQLSRKKVAELEKEVEELRRVVLAKGKM